MCKYNTFPCNTALFPILYGYKFKASNLLYTFMKELCLVQLFPYISFFQCYFLEIRLCEIFFFSEILSPYYPVTLFSIMSSFCETRNQKKQIDKFFILWYSMFYCK